MSERKSKIEKEIVEILKKYGANHISDKQISQNNSLLTLISIYKKTEISLKKGIAVFIAQNNRFKTQNLPINTIGICQENNTVALQSFKTNNLAVITCGIGNKNTITLSSIENKTILASLQRTIIDIRGNAIYPCELKIELNNNYSPISIMTAVTILLLNGITPKEF